jgi:hypothetical protein
MPQLNERILPAVGEFPRRAMMKAIPSDSVENDDKMPLTVPLNFNDRRYAISRSTYKISAQHDEPIACGFCQRLCDAQERYIILEATSDDSDQWWETSFTFCKPCIDSAAADFRDMPNPSVVRFLAAKIERDGATVRTEHGTTSHA